MRIKIGIDWDDVTAPFNSIAIKMANSKYNLDLILEDIKDWANEGKASVIKEFYSEPKLYELQTKNVSAKTIEIINKLEEIADVYFITAVHPNFMGTRAAQIQELFPNLPAERIILGAAKYLVKFDIILDDNICNVLDSPATYPVLMRKPWNSTMTGVLSVNNIEEFYNLVTHILFNKKEHNTSIPRVFAIVGPSGSGKQEIIDKLCDTGNFARPLSYSTKELNNKNTVKISEQEFKNTDFVEKTRYAGYGYGTRYEDIRSVLNSGKNAIMALDMCGAIGMKSLFDTTIVFVKRRKDYLIRNILEDNLTNDERTLRLLSIEAEKKNENLCDISIDNSNDANNAISELLSQI